MGKSLRALHWAESKHPRDDRGRFSRKGGGKWVERVGERAKASFGDLNLGYEVGRGPAGRLETGKGGLIDIGGLHKAAKAAKAAQAPSVGRPGGGEKVNPQSLSVGDRFLNAQGVEHEVLSNPVTGRRAGAAVARMKVRRVSDGKEGPLTLNGQVTKLDTARVPEQSDGMKSTTEIDTRRAGADATGRDRGALARSAGGVMSKEAAGRRNTAAMKLQDQQKATPEQLAGVLRKHGLEAVAKDVDAGRYSKAATKLHDHTLDAMRNAPFEKRQEVRGVYNDLSRMPDDIGDAEDLDGMTVEKLGREWVVNDTSKDGKTVHMYGSTSKADAEDWARTAAASRLAMRAGDVNGSHAIHADRKAALGGGEGRIYRPQGSVAKVSATSAAARKVELQAKIKAHRDGAASGGNADGGNFADDLRKEMGSQDGLAKATARGRTPAGAKLPTTSGGKVNAKSARAENRELRNAEGGNVDTTAGSVSKSTQAYDRLLADDGAQNKSMRQILEQMEAHGWEIKTFDPQVQVLGATAPDGRMISIQFPTDKKPHIRLDNKYNSPDVTFKKALAHVVTPTHEEVGSPNVSGAMERLGMPSLSGKSWTDPGLVSRDRTYKPLDDAQRAMMSPGTGSGGKGFTGPQAAAQLRAAAAQNRLMADQRADYNRGIHGERYAEDHNTQVLRERADQFEAVAADLEQAHTARQAFEAERDRRAALPLDIRPGRSVAAKPATRVGRTASGERVETPKPTGIERVMKARSNSEKSAAFKELTADQIVEAFQRDPGKALDAYMQKNFGKDSGRANALPGAVDNIAANLKAGDITPEQAAEQMRQWARLHAGMQHHRYMTLAADLLDGTVAKRRENKITPNAEGGNVEAPKVEPRRYQTFADRMAGDMTDADRRAGHAESDRRRAELRAQEAEQARQRAEAEANDTRSEREKLTQKLRDAYTVREIGMRSGRLDPKREAAIKTAEARLAAMDTEDRHAKIKELGVVKGDTIKTPLGEFEVTGTTKDGYLRIVRPDGRRGSVAPKNVESVTKGSVLPKADAGGSPGADGRVSEVTIWNSDTRRPERTERRTVKVVGLDQVGTPEERATIERSIDAGLSAYRAGYRPPTFEVTKTGVESLGAHYDQFGLRVGKDRVRIHPSHAEHRAEQLPHTIRHEIAHRAEWVLRAKVEARDGVDAAETWKRNVDRATLAWLDRARREAPDDPRLKYASLTQHFRDTGHAHEVGDPADEAFADLVGHLADGEEVPGDPSEVLALIRGADPAGIFTESRDTTKVDTPRVSVQASEMTANDDTKSPFKMGQRVEVLAHDFTKPGQPREWKPGKVTGVQPQDNGRHDIMVTADDGTRHPHIVGVRGGNKNVRAAGQAPTTVATTEEIRSGQAGDHLRHFERDAASGVDTDVLRAVRDDERAPANFRTAARSELARRGAGPRGEELTRLREQGRKREQGIGPTPEVTGYVKGREVRPGMLINAADLLGMHERQGSTTGENPNPLGHAEWVRVGLIGNTNEKGFRQWGEGTLTGGMYVVLDTSGRPVGRMSANTIAEMSGTLDGAPEHMLDTVRMPAKVAKTVSKRGPNGEKIETTEMVDGFEAVHVPSKAAQEELGLPTPKMRSNGILDPADPNYGANATHPTPAHRPFGRPVKGSRTRAEAAADRAKRREVYASGETERAQRRAEAEAQRKADAAATREQQRIEDEKKLAASREQYRRDTITRRHEQLQRDLARTDPEVYDRSINNVRSGTPEEFAAQRLTQGSSDLKWLASAYGLKTRGTTVQEQADGIVAAVKAGKTPDLEVGAPKVLGETEQAAAEAKKIATADKRRRNEVTKNFDTLKVAIQADEKDPRFNWSGKPDPRVADHFSLYMSETQMRQLAEAFGLEALTGRALRDAIVEAIKAGRQPDLSAAPITSLKKSRR